MTRLTIDPVTLAKLHNLDGLVEVCDESRKTLGYFHPVAHASGVSQTVRSPFPEEELQQRRQQRTGRSLAEVLERLGRS
jgi:hypothetical protein